MADSLETKYTLEQIKNRIRMICFDLLDKGATESEIITAFKEIVDEHIELPTEQCSKCIWYMEEMGKI